MKKLNRSHGLLDGNGSLEEPLWTKNFILAMAQRACSSLVFSLFNVSVATYVFTLYQSSASHAGLAVGMFAIAAIFSRLFAGKYFDIVGPKRMMLIGTFIYFIFTILYFLPVGFGLFLVVRFCQGLGFGIQSNCITSIVVNLIPESRRGEGLSHFQMASKLTTSIGPFLGLPLLNVCGFTSIIIVCSVATLCCFLTACFIEIDQEKDKAASAKTPQEQKENSHSEKTKKTRLSFNEWVASFFEKSAIPIALAAAVINGCYGTIVAFINTYASCANLSNWVNWYFIVYMIMLLISRPILGKSLDKHRPQKVLIFTAGIFAIGEFVLAAVPISSSVSIMGGVVILLLAASFVSVGFSGSFLGTQMTSLKDVTKDKVPRVTSTYYALADVGMGLLPSVFSIVVPVFGYAGMFITCGVSLIGLMLVIFIKERAK